MLSEAKHLGFFRDACETTIIGCTFSPINMYIGITNNISRRLFQHRYADVGGFTKRYHLNRVVWVEHFRNVNDAIACEKKLKVWRRSRKIALIAQTNPRWLDLSDDWEQQRNVYERPHSVEEMI